MPDFVLKVAGLGKKYRLGGPQSYGTLRDAIARLWHRRPRESSEKEFWALRNVGFEVRSGDALGIVGRNGAGKSTLLKVLSRITSPDEGIVELEGRVGALLEVGTGFHPELTGRENVFLNGVLLGMTKADVRSKFDEIVSFSGVEQFLDTPVKRYSSGMRVRLGFAVAAHLEPEILVVDEVLAVGDAEFQRRCLGRMQEVSQEGRTVLFVSHQMEAIQSLCTRAVWLDQGMVVKDGSPDDVVRSYLSSVLDLGAQTSLQSRTDRTGEGRYRVMEFAASGEGGSTMMTGQPAVFSLVVSHIEPQVGDDFVINIVLRDHMDRMLTLLSNNLTGSVLSVTGDRSTIACRVTKLPLVPGRHSADISLWVRGTRQDKVQHAITFDVGNGDFFSAGRAIHVGSFHIEQQWEGSGLSRSQS
jgi:lipopolysaccharide transport system ATP-binding protein